MSITNLSYLVKKKKKNHNLSFLKIQNTTYQLNSEKGYLLKSL
jgi:hypothetical protein